MSHIYFDAIPKIPQPESDFNKSIWAFKPSTEDKNQDIINFIISKLLPELQKHSTQDENLTQDLSQDHKKVIELLLNYKSELGLTRKNYPLLILLAAKIGDQEIFNLVLNDCRKSIDSISEEERNSDLQEITESFHFGRRDPLLPPLIPQELNYQGPSARTALHYAVRQELPEVVRFLLNRGADVNCKTVGYYTPLHYACCLQNEEIVKILLSFGADVNVISSQYRTALHFVCGRCEFRRYFIPGGELEYAEYTSTFAYRMNPFYEPKLVINLEIMKLLLERRANPEVLGELGTNSLHEACRAGNLEAVKLLLSFGVNLRSLDKENNTCLHYATAGNCYEIINLLLKNGLEIESRNKIGYTPLHYITHYERISNKVKIKMIQYLVDFGADVNARHKGDGTPLHIAAYFDQPDVIECLLELGADVKLRYNQNSSPALGYILSDACMSGRPPQGPGFRALVAYVAMKENCLDDYINFYLLGPSLEVNSIFQACKMELLKLRSTRIVNNLRISFYDFLTCDFFTASEIMKKEELRNVLHSGDHQIAFHYYGFLIQKRFERIKDLKNSVEKSVDFIKAFWKEKLPTFVIEIVFTYLGSKDFRNFGRALSVQENFN